MPSVVRVTVVHWNSSKNRKRGTVEQDRQDYWLQQGRCPTCGIHTHEKVDAKNHQWQWWSRPNREWKPLCNDHVVNGRCLACWKPPDGTKDDDENDEDAEDKKEEKNGLTRATTTTTTASAMSEGFVTDATVSARGLDDESDRPPNGWVGWEASHLSPEAPPPPPAAAARWQEEEQKHQAEQLKRAKVFIGCASVVAALVIAGATLVSVLQRNGAMPRTSPRQHLPEHVLPPPPPPPPRGGTMPTNPTTSPTGTLLPTQQPTNPLPTPQPSVDPVKLARRAHVERLVRTISSEKDLNNPQSPQHQALEWVLLDDEYAQANRGSTTILSGAPPHTPDWIVVQRYVLALFFESTGGSHTWSRDVIMARNSFLNVQHNECEWHDSIYCEGYRLYPHILPTELELQRRVTGLEFDGFGLFYNRNGPSGIVGHLPHEMFQGLPYLQRIIILGEGLRGTIPSTLGALPHLELVDLSHHPELEGALPPALLNATSMKHILAESCQLEGTLPSTVSPSLESLVVADNFLSGTLPSEWGNLPRLLFLHLRRNSFTGRIPRVWGRAKTLRALTLHRNDIRGRVPSTLCELQHLSKLTVDCASPPDNDENGKKKKRTANTTTDESLDPSFSPGQNENGASNQEEEEEGVGQAEEATDSSVRPDDDDDDNGDDGKENERIEYGSEGDVTGTPELDGTPEHDETPYDEVPELDEVPEYDEVPEFDSEMEGMSFSFVFDVRHEIYPELGFAAKGEASIDKDDDASDESGGGGIESGPEWQPSSFPSSLSSNELALFEPPPPPAFSGQSRVSIDQGSNEAKVKCDCCTKCY